MLPCVDVAAGISHTYTLQVLHAFMFAFLHIQVHTRQCCSISAFPHFYISTFPLVHAAALPHFYMSTYQRCCISAFLHFYISTFLHSDTPMFLHLYICMYMATFLHFHIYVFLHDQLLHVHISAFLHFYISAFLHFYISTFLHLYIYIYTSMFQHVDMPACSKLLSGACTVSVCGDAIARSIDMKRTAIISVGIICFHRRYQTQPQLQCPRRVHFRALIHLRGTETRPGRS